MALLLCVSGAGAGAASASVDRIYERNDLLAGLFAGYAFPPAHKLLRGARLTEYRLDMAIGACRSAAFKLEKALRERLARALAAKGGVDPGLAFHRVVLARAYPEVALCQAVEELRLAQRQIVEKMLPAPRLRQKHDIAEYLAMGAVERLRNRAVADIINIALRDYAPAMVTLARIAESGAIVRLTPEFAYFILARARKKGLAGKELDRLLAKARAALGPSTLKALAPMIRAGKWPRWAPVVRD